jgi:hypothetical protein
MAKVEDYTLKTTVDNDDLFWGGDSTDTDADGDFKTKRYKGSLLKGGGTDTKAVQVIGGGAGMFSYNTTPGPLDTDTGTNGQIQRHMMDDTTEEYILHQNKVCSDLNLSGTATIRVDGYAKTCTPTTTTKIEITVRVSGRTAGESWDAAYTTTVSGDLTLKTTQDAFDHHSFTVVASTLGIAANDSVRLMVSRTAPTTQNLSGDYGITYAAVDLPRS